MIIAQITDTHIALPDTPLDRNMQTAEHLARMVAHLNAFTPRPDLVMISGDLVDQRSAAEYARLRGLLDELAMPYYMLVGNHDDRDALRDAFPDHAYLAGHDGFVQYILDDGAVRIIALDTLIPGAAGGELCDTRLAWLAGRLEDGPARPTIIFMHHPPFRTGLAIMDAMGLADAGALERLIARYDNILRIQCGHLHRPISTRFANTVAATCPATAHQIALDLDNDERLGVVFEPPACQLHIWYGADDGLISHTSYIGEYDRIDLSEAVKPYAKR